MVREPSIQLELLGRHWPQIKDRVEQTQRELINSIPPDDPIKHTVDLLSPIGCGRAEVRHTRALAYLCDENKSHKLKRIVLRRVIEKVNELSKDTKSVAIAANVLKLINAKQADVIVATPEYPNDAGRNDIRIERRRDSDKQPLVIIENKIKRHVDPLKLNDQLDGYKKDAYDLCDRHKWPRPLLVLLAPTEHEQKGWVSVTYLQLASALRKAWEDSKSALSKSFIGRMWLELYIATIIPGVLQTDIMQLKKEDIEIYLDQELPSAQGGLQMENKLIIPAISREFDFYLRNWKIMDVIDEDEKADPSEQEKVREIYERAKNDFDKLIKDFKDALESVADKLFGSSDRWHLTESGWDCYRYIYIGNGKRKRFGSIGMYPEWNLTASEKPTLIGYFEPENDRVLDDLLLSIREKVKDVYEEEGLMKWLYMSLSFSTSHADIQSEVKKMAKAFFEAAIPAFKKFA